MILKEYYVLKNKESNSYLCLDYHTKSFIFEDDINAAYRFDHLLDIDKLFEESKILTMAEPVKITIRDNNISEDCKDIKVFADKIKNHMMKYCRARIEAQYCAEEVISFIDTLLGIDNKSTRIMNVEKEWEDADDNAVKNFFYWLDNNINYDSLLFRDVYEKYKEEKNNKNKSSLKLSDEIVKEMDERGPISTPDNCVNGEAFEEYLANDPTNFDNVILDFCKWCYINGIDFSHMVTSEEIESGISFIQKVIDKYKEFLRDYRGI